MWNVNNPYLSAYGAAPPTPPRRYAAQCGAAVAAFGQPPPAPSAWPRAAKSCGARGSHFPALFDYFNLERNSP